MSAFFTNGYLEVWSRDDNKELPTIAQVFKFGRFTEFSSESSRHFVLITFLIISRQIKASTYYSVNSVEHIFCMHSLKVASQQKIFGFEGDEFTFNNLNRMIKITAKTARKVVDILRLFAVPLSRQFFAFNTLPLSSRSKVLLSSASSAATRTGRILNATAFWRFRRAEKWNCPKLKICKFALSLVTLC